MGGISKFGIFIQNFLFLGMVFQVQFIDKVKWDEESESEEKIWKKVGLWAQIGLLWMLTTFTTHTEIPISTWNILQKGSKIFFFNLEIYRLLMSFFWKPISKLVISQSFRQFGHSLTDRYRVKVRVSSLNRHFFKMWPFSLKTLPFFYF